MGTVHRQTQTMPKKFLIHGNFLDARGFLKGKRMLEVNPKYTGGVDSITLDDLLNFLKEKKINPSQVIILKGLMTYVKE